MNLEFARWAEPHEIETFHKYLRQKKQTKQDYTTNWLATNGSIFIESHHNFYNDYLLYINEKRHQDYVLRLASYQLDMEKYRALKNERGYCVCKGNLRHIKRDDYEFIGCENYREQGFEHYKIYPPNMPIPPVDETDLELNTAYLFKLKQLYGFPQELKESILYEYLILNKIETLVDLSQKFTMLPNIKGKSDKRERILKPMLDNIFEKVYHQKYIMIKEFGQRQKLARPDFICMKKDFCYVIEQKKNFDSIRESQLRTYIAAVSLMIQKANKPYKVKGLFLLEEGESDIDKDIYTIDTILTL
jgi:hypothetical protein